MRIGLSISKHINNLLEDLSHARKQNKSECMRDLIIEAYSKEPRIQKMQIKPIKN